MKQKRKGERSSVTEHLLLTALAGLIFWIIGEKIYASAMPKMANPIALALYFAAFGLVMMILLFFLPGNKADFSDPRTKKDFRHGHRIGLAAFCVFLVLTVGFEFLYELGKQPVPDPTSYIFLIDDSGSMSGTEQLRTDGITSIMEHNSSNLPYAVYMFTDHADSIKAMDSYRAGDAGKIQFQSDGNTDILGSLSTVLSDLQTGKITGAGSAPRVLLLSDGNSGDYGLKDLCEQAAAQGVSVSTVGMGSSNDRMLKRIAALTGGVFVRCDDASTLGETMETAITSSAERNLLSERFVFKNDTLYGILRVVFLMLMGVVWSFFKSGFVWGGKEGDRALKLSILCCAAAALIMELGASAGASPERLRLIFCILWALTYGSVRHLGSRRVSTTPRVKIDPIPEPPENPPADPPLEIIGQDDPSEVVKTRISNDNSETESDPPESDPPEGENPFDLDDDIFGQQSDDSIL